VIRSASRRSLALLAALLLVGSACASLPWPFAKRQYRGDFTQEDLATELAAYAARFGAVVGNTAEDIREQSPVRTVRRRALIWQIQMPPLMDDVAFGDSPRFAYFATVLVAIAQQRYLSDGDGRDLFEGMQPHAVQAADSLVEDVLAIGQRFLTAKQLAEVEQHAREFAEKYPIQGRDFSIQRVPRAVVSVQAQQSLGWLISLPLAPFTALQGVDSGADAIHDFNRTAQEFAQITRQLPERIRWQLELFLYDVEDRDTVTRSVDAMDRVATSSQEIAATAQRLPEDLRKTLLDTQGPVDAVGKIVTQLDALATPLAETATQLERASASWLAILGPNDPGPPDPNKRPFDVRDWQAAAQSIGTAANELRGLATDLDTLGASPSLDAAVDRIFWRGVALIGVFFGALLVYRVLTARLTRRDA